MTAAVHSHNIGFCLPDSKNDKNNGFPFGMSIILEYFSGFEMRLRVEMLPEGRFSFSWHLAALN